MMKKILLVTIVVLAPLMVWSQDKIRATYFYSPHCKACLKVRQEVLPPLKEKYKDTIEWRELDTTNPQHLSSLYAVSARYGKAEALVPAIHVGDKLIVGYDDLVAQLDTELALALERKATSPFDFVRTDLLDVFKNISLLTVIGSGLIDGVNPCAFAVVVFFISFLGVYGYQKREMFFVGVAYCTAVFVTYLLIGLGFFSFFYRFTNIYLLIKGFYYFIAFFCFLMGLFALRDYFTFKKTGSAEGSILQLPAILKKRINIVIGSRMRQKSAYGILGLLVTAFVVGVMVSLLEAVCTGQVYLPTIVFILKNTDLRLRAATYLILYNLMFIAPLIAVFLLSLAGVNSSRFNEFLKARIGVIKLLMALLFFVLGGLIFNLN